MRLDRDIDETGTDEKIRLGDYYDYVNNVTYLLSNASKSGLLFDVQYQKRGRKFP